MLPTLPIPMIGALILAFFCLSLLNAQRRLSALAVLVAVCAVQSGLIALVFHYGFDGLRGALPLVASCIAPLSWVALQRSGMEQRHSVWLHLGGPAVTVLAVFVQPFALDVIIPLLFFCYGAAILYAVSRGGDALPRLRLESGETSGRTWRWIGAALIASGLSDVAIVATLVAGQPHWHPLIVGVGSAGMLLLMGALSLSRSVSDVPERAVEPELVAPTVREEDTQIMARLDQVLEGGQLYLDPDLTLTRLARRLGLPVKVLSTAINRVSGENVSRYINGFRIRAACTALEQGASVTQTMLNAGFNTKSNFNREFLRITGKTPRAYRGERGPAPTDQRSAPRSFSAS